MPIISIIVPVYKTGAYICRCIDSILDQSYTDFELILVDDGSPDDCGVICDKYLDVDDRVKVIHKANGGVSTARNAGLDVAIGKYVVFVDSDDYVGRQYLQDMIEEVELNQADTLILTDYQSFSSNGIEVRTLPCAFNVELDNGTSKVYRDLIFGFRLFPPYCKLFLRSIIEENGIRFNTEIKSAEDFDFNIRYIKHISTIKYIPRAQYYYRIDYKSYTPSNDGVLGDSEIKSAHIMAHGIVSLARRMGIYEEMYPELCAWAADKHYLNRLRMLFRKNAKIGFFKRHVLYNRLVNDQNYYGLARRGAISLPHSTTKTIARYFDYFPIWYIFYKLTKQF